MKIARYVSGGLAVLAALLLRTDAVAGCLTVSENTACGYTCKASYGDIRCAQTPLGICSFASGILACWDPPAILRRVYEKQPPKVKCVTSYGQTACGYHCLAGSDRVQCAQTPFGACRIYDGKVKCWDPPAQVVLAKGEQTPRAECIASSGKLDCGYHCLAGDGVVRCAETPEGTCTIRRGAVICWDPPLDSYAVAFDGAAEKACIDGPSGRSCGFTCIATIQHSGCGTDRDHSCKAEPNGIVCGKTE